MTTRTRPRRKPFRIRPNRVRILMYTDVPEEHKNDADHDWTKNCIVCGQSPIVPVTEMCGPCTFGEASTAGGNW